MPVAHPGAVEDADDDAVLTEQYLPEFTRDPGIALAHDISDMRALQPDMDAMYTRLTLAVGGPWLSPNEARSEAGFPDAPDEGMTEVGGSRQAGPATDGDDDGMMDEADMPTPIRARRSVKARATWSPDTLERWRQRADAILARYEETGDFVEFMEQQPIVARYRSELAYAQSCAATPIRTRRSVKALNPREYEAVLRALKAGQEGPLVAALQTEFARQKRDALRRLREGA
jgi:hypothetical protein